MKALNWTIALASILMPPFLAVWWFVTETHGGGGWYTFAFILFVVPAVVAALIPGILVVITVAICRGSAKVCSYLIAAPIVWLITMVPPIAMSDFGDAPDSYSPSILEDFFGVSPEVSGRIALTSTLLAFVGWIVLFGLAIFLIIANGISLKRERDAINAAYFAAPNAPYPGIQPAPNHRPHEISQPQHPQNR